MGKLKINMYLKSVKSELKPILLNISFGYKETNPLNNRTTYIPLYYSSGLSVKDSDWSKELSLPKDRQKVAELLELETIVENTYKRLELQNVKITPTLFKSELDEILGRKVTQDVNIVPLREYIETVVEKDPNRGASIRKQFKHLRTKLKEYEDANNIELNNETLNRFHFLNFIEKLKGELSKQNAVWNIQKNLTTALNEMQRDFRDLSILKVADDLSSKEKVSKIVEKKIYLEFSQMTELIEHEPSTEKLRNTKMILLVLLFTGCRYSDVFKVQPDHEYEDDNVKFRYAHFITTKNPTEVIIPFLKPLEEMLTNNDGKMPYKISSQKFNSYVKDLCEEIGWKDEVKMPYTDSYGVKQFEIKPFFKHISSHIGRRSFISNLIEFVPVTLLSKVTGHTFTDKEVIFQYNKTSLQKSAVRFVKTLKRVSGDPDFKDDFPIQLL